MRENDQLRTWAAAVIGCDVFDIQPLHEDQGPWRVADRYVLRAPTPRIGPRMVATGVAALQVAAEYELPAPRLIDADLTGERAGVPASLETLVPGTTSWPVGTPATLRAAGAALTRLHALSLRPAEHLPFRPRPIAVDDFAADRRSGLMPTTPLLQQADDLVTAHGLPSDPAVFLHGDVWPGNLLWSANQVTAFIDWKTAGVGAPGVDLSELRKQAAITFGLQAPIHVLTGWEQASGLTASHVAYWDAVAALNTRTTLDDWGIPNATTRRNNFLEAALTHL
ncbi:aminoglycoside phosphotransferase family protein [Kribbella sp. NPDC048928]|uniref:aminoglycoside phosphotransferase family protein n=1 Tax=Kribbella sp. NPDC048928 TaxID=3364111 RepID=UPI00372087EC